MDFAFENKIEMPQLRQVNNNIASKAVEEVISKNRKDKLKENMASRELFETHLQNMKLILDTYEYEITNMHKILSNSRKMKIWDVQHYLNVIEALAFGYKKLYGIEITIPLLTGIITKSNDLYTLNKYYDLLISEMIKRVNLAESKTKIEERKIEELTLKLKYEESNIFKIFKKSKIESVKRNIIIKKRKIERYKARAEKYKTLLSSTRNMLRAEK
ncbi:MAG: hypothetical protein ACP5RT_02235 [Candidatus Micrarchaeia archaeon]